MSRAIWLGALIVALSMGLLGVWYKGGAIHILLLQAGSVIGIAVGWTAREVWRRVT